jgi:hypothetical protein
MYVKSEKFVSEENRNEVEDARQYCESHAEARIETCSSFPNALWFDNHAIIDSL